jgi:hypothetical protein
MLDTAEAQKADVCQQQLGATPSSIKRNEGWNQKNGEHFQYVF